jgi:hopanoid C-3 methylase
MKVLAVSPSCLMYSKIFLRLEPLGIELIAAAARQSGHDVRLIDLQVEKAANYERLLRQWQPDAVALSCNYLANVPEVIELARAARNLCPVAFVFVGGHSASFIAGDLLAHGAGVVDCVLKGEGEAALEQLLAAAAERDPKALLRIPGVVTQLGAGPPPGFVKSLDGLIAARDLLRHRRKYFIGVLDPCASIEFSRGCPWDCSFCSAWTFYGRSYRLKSPDVAVAELAQIREPGVFIVDDVAFIQAEHGMAIGEAIARRGIKKQYYLETRGDVLLRNKDVFRFWKQLGLQYIFLGVEALDEEGLARFRKRVSVSKNFEALEFARSLGVMVAINIIADPAWDRRQFALLRDWCLDIPEIVNISVNTPYPGTETWLTESRRLATRDYRLFDIQHAVLPTTLPIADFYEELVRTQSVLNRKHLGWRAVKSLGRILAGNLARGQTNTLKMLWKFHGVYDPKLQLSDHHQPVKYELTPPPEAIEVIDAKSIYVHPPPARNSRVLDEATESFVNGSRLSAEAGTRSVSAAAMAVVSAPSGPAPSDGAPMAIELDISSSARVPRPPQGAV